MALLLPTTEPASQQTAGPSPTEESQPEALSPPVLDQYGYPDEKFHFDLQFAACQLSTFSFLLAVILRGPPTRFVEKAKLDSESP